MKTTVLILTVALAGVLAGSGIEKKQNNLAEVNQMQGLYLFIDCKPVNEFELLGTVSVSIGWSGQYEPVRNNLIKKSKKEFPEANGLIFYLNRGGTDRADAIKFTE